MGQFRKSYALLETIHHTLGHKPWFGCTATLDEETFERGLLEYPHYTRPADFRGMKVPEVLLSGNHAEIARWRLFSMWLERQQLPPASRLRARWWRRVSSSAGWEGWMPS